MTYTLTPPQKAALDVLAAVPDGKKIRGHKRSTQAEPVPRVNIQAVGRLCDIGLARRHYAETWAWSPYTHDEKYTITAAGRAAALCESHEPKGK